MRGKFVIDITTAPFPVNVGRVDDVLGGRSAYAVVSFPNPLGGYVIVRVARAFAGACREDMVNALLPIEGSCSYYTSARNVREALEYLREFLNWEKVMVPA